jgi:hypothetical protein
MMLCRRHRRGVKVWRVFSDEANISRLERLKATIAKPFC